MQKRVDALQHEMSEVKLALSSVLGFEQVTHALSEIAEQLQPLRELRSEPPPGQDLDRAHNQSPAVVEDRPREAGLERSRSLSVADKDVGFIGQV